MSFTYNINLGLLGESNLDKAVSSIDKLESTIDKLNSKLERSGGQFDKINKKGTAAAGSLTSAFGKVAAVIGGIGFLKDSVSTASELETLSEVIKFSGGTEGARNLKFVQQAAKDLRIDLLASMDGFRTLSGSMMGTNITAQQQRDIFYAVGVASRAMGLEASQTNSVLLALGQMASKGTVSSQELKLQLGNALPGAMGIAARAMGVTVTELDIMISKGDVLATKFLPKLANELVTTFSPALEAKLKTSSALFQDTKNRIFDLKVMVGNELMPAVLAMLTDWLIPTAKWIIENKEVVISLAIGLGSLALAVKIATAAQWLLNAALLANPVGAVALAIGALVGWLVHLYRNSMKAREVLTGLWYVIRDVGEVIITGMVQPLKTAGGLLLGIVTGDFDMIKSTISSANDTYDNAFLKMSRIGQTYREGARAGLESWWDDLVKSGKADKSFGAGAFLNKPSATEDVFDPTQPGPWHASHLATAQRPDAYKPDSKLKDGMKGINEGGRHSKVINISLDNIVQRLEINAGTVTEGMDDMVDVVTRKLTQLINNANQVQTTF